MTTEELMAEVARLRDALKRIEALVWYEPEDYDDLVEAVRVMACERNEKLSRVRDQQAEIAELHAEVERLRARVRSVDRSTAYEGTAFSDGESSQEDLAVVASERDEARAEVERLRGELSAMRVQRALERARNGWAEVERLRSALAQAQRADE